MTTLVTASSKAQLAYDWLRERIADGRFGPGYRLVLGQIASELGCSVVPVREAIRMLEAEGAVTYVHNVGATVTVLDRTTYRQTMETLALVEGFATAAAAPSLTATDLDRARRINAQMRTVVAAHPLDARAFTALNHRLHEVLFSTCTNDHVIDLVHRGWHRLETMRESSFGFVPERARASVEEHEQLIELIASGADAAAIEHSAREHRLTTMRAVLATTEPRNEQEVA